MSTSPRHGDPGCPCEECLSALIRLSAALASDGRYMAGLRHRLNGLELRIGAPLERLESAS